MVLLNYNLLALWRFNYTVDVFDVLFFKILVNFEFLSTLKTINQMPYILIYWNVIFGFKGNMYFYLIQFVLLQRKIDFDILRHITSKFLFDRKKAMIRAKQEQGFRSRSNEIVMDIRDTTPVEIVGGDFVNRKLEDGLAGKLLTTNSLKFYGNKITKEYGFALKMHKLRKTNLTYLAENGASFKYLKEHAGHLKVETTLKYYIKAGETSKEQGMRILDSMTTEDPLITIEGPGIGGQETRVFTVRKSQWERIQSEQRRKK